MISLVDLVAFHKEDKILLWFSVADKCLPVVFFILCNEYLASVSTFAELRVRIKTNACSFEPNHSYVPYICFGKWVCGVYFCHAALPDFPLLLTNTCYKEFALYLQSNPKHPTLESLSVESISSKSCNSTR